MSARRSAFFYLLLVAIGMALLANSVQAAPINWRNNLETAKTEANRTGKLVLVHFYTASCGPCKKLERDVFSQPQIAAAIESNYIPVKLNADQAPATANAYRITRVPTEVVLTPQGNVVQTLSCPLEPEPYGKQIVNVAKHYQLSQGNRTASAQAPMHAAYAGLKVGQHSTSTQVANHTPPATKQSVAPAVTQNPYYTPAPPAKQPTMPANAMPNSYGNRYAAQSPTTTQPTAGTLQAPTTPPSVAVPATTAAAPVTTTTPSASTAASQQQSPKTPAAPAWPPQLPTGAPKLAFDGYCPVSLQQVRKWVKGNPAFGAIHRGRTYIFAGEVERQKFLASPDSYSPVFSGNDPVVQIDEGRQVEGSRKYGFEYRGAFYLFSSEETMNRFSSQPDRYSAGVRQAMNLMDAGGTIRR